MRLVHANHEKRSLEASRVEGKNAPHGETILRVGRARRQSARCLFMDDFDAF